jgi:hypothetical protein
MTTWEAISFSSKMANPKELLPKILNKNFTMLEYLFIWEPKFKLILIINIGIFPQLKTYKKSILKSNFQLSKAMIKLPMTFPNIKELYFDKKKKKILKLIRKKSKKFINIL